MIKDYVSLLAICFILSLTSIIVSFIYHVSIHEIVDVFTNLDGYDFTQIQTEYEKFYNLTNTIQIIGIFSIFLNILGAVLLVTRIRFSPLALPFAIIMYLVGIFIAMAFSNSTYYIMEILQEYDVTFTLNTYISWISLNLPWIVGISGALLMYFAYAKAPGSGSPNKGGISFD